MSLATIRHTNANTRNELRTFIDQLIPRLNEDERKEQKEALNKIQSSLSCSFPNLLSLEQYIVSIKNQIIIILTTLNEDELNTLNDIAPCYFKNIREIANKSIPDSLLRSGVLLRIAEAFAKDGKIDKAIEISNTISDPKKHSYALRSISTALINMNNINRPIEITETIT